MNVFILIDNSKQHASQNGLILNQIGRVYQAQTNDEIEEVRKKHGAINGIFVATHLGVETVKRLSRLSYTSDIFVLGIIDLEDVAKWYDAGAKHLFASPLIELPEYLKMKYSEAETSRSEIIVEHLDPDPVVTRPSPPVEEIVLQTQSTSDTPKERPKQQVQSVKKKAVQEKVKQHSVPDAAPRPPQAEKKVEAPPKFQPLKPTFKILTNRFVVIGGLYAGAGSTFTTVSLARVLNQLGIPAAVVEYPNQDPQLYSLLYGDEKAPKGYSFLMEDLVLEEMAQRRLEWKDEHTTWIPVNPHSNKKDWSIDQIYKLIYSVKSTITLLDVSGRWQDEAVKELCKNADEILFIVDGYPMKRNTPAAVQNKQILAELERSGRTVHIIANRDIQDRRHSDREEWIRSLPRPPLCIIPELPYEEHIKAIWKGELLQDREDHQDGLLTAFYPLIHRLIPAQSIQLPRQKQNLLMRVFGRFFQTDTEKKV